jgi:hypothetical protein
MKQEPDVERGKSQIHSLLFENDQFKRGVQRLTRELEMLKKKRDPKGLFLMIYIY